MKMEMGSKNGLMRCLSLTVLALACLAQAGDSNERSVVIPMTRAASNDRISAHVSKVRSILDTGDSSQNLRGGPKDMEGSTFLSMLQTSSTTAAIHDNERFEFLEYHGDVQIKGSDESEPHTFSMLFDTASAHTWIPSTTCVTCCPADTRESAPPIVQEDATPMSETFPSGSWFSGVAQKGDMILGDDLVVESLTYYQIFVKGHKTLPVRSPEESEECADSVLGLSFSTRWDEPASPSHRRLTHRELDELEKQEGIRLSLVDRLFQQHLVTRALFSLYLTFEKDGSELEIGSYQESRIDPRRNPDGLFWVSAVGFPDYHWAFNVPRLCLDDDCQRTGNIAARVSSAVPYIALPQELYKLLRRPHDRVANPCHIMKDLPTLTLLAMGANDKHPSDRFSGRLSLCPADYVLPGEDGTCDFAIVPTKLPMIVLGTPFIRKFFTVFDIENKRMGFAQSTEQCQKERPTPEEEVAQIETMKKVIQRAAQTRDDLDPEVVSGLMSKLEKAQKDAMGPPPFLQEGTFLTHHKSFVN